MAILNYVFLFIIMAGIVSVQSGPSIDDALQRLPPELQGKVNESDIENIKNKSSAMFKEKCEKNGAADAYVKAKKASEDFPTCVKESLNLTDTNILEKEIEAAKKNGTVDEIFKRYCDKTPLVKQCFNSLTETVKPCFSSEEQKNLKTLYNITEQLAEFICYKDGDRIALFIAEGGPECFQEKQDQIKDCVNATIGVDYQFNADDVTSNGIPEIEFGPKECEKFTALQTCVVQALESCEAPTSANIVESLFKFARQATPCKLESKKSNSATSLAMTSATTIIALTIALF